MIRISPEHCDANVCRVAVERESRLRPSDGMRKNGIAPMPQALLIAVLEPVRSSLVDVDLVKNASAIAFQK